MRELIRRDQDCEELRRRLLDGAASPEAEPAAAAYFDKLRERVRGQGDV